MNDIITLNAVADTMIRTDLDLRRNDNYGKESVMMVGTSRGGGGIPYGGADALRSLLKFDLANISHPVEHATLQLTVQGYDPQTPEAVPFQVEVHQILAPWTEGNGLEEQTNPSLVPGSIWVDEASGVAWENLDGNNENQPNFDASSVATAIFTPTEKPRASVVELDITSLVKSWINNPSSNYGIMLLDPTKDPQNSFRVVALGTREGDLYPNAFSSEVKNQTPRLVITYADSSNLIDLSTLRFTKKADIVPKWGTSEIINTGNANTLAGDDSITGYASGTDSKGIHNDGIINTGNGNDIITGTGSTGIYNDGIINTENGKDSIIANGGFAGTGSVFLGEGKDYLKGFGNGNFNGGNGKDTLELTSGSYAVGISGTTVNFTNGTTIMNTSEFEKLIAGHKTYDFNSFTNGQIVIVA